MPQKGAISLLPVINRRWNGLNNRPPFNMKALELSHFSEQAGCVRFVLLLVETSPAFLFQYQQLLWKDDPLLSEHILPQDSSLLSFPSVSFSCAYSTRFHSLFFMKRKMSSLPQSTLPSVLLILASLAAADYPILSASFTWYYDGTPSHPPVCGPTAQTTAPTATSATPPPTGSNTSPASRPRTALPRVTGNGGTSSPSPTQTP